MARIFLISDTHFNHRNIIRYCNRPFNSIEEMNETLISNWNKVVNKEDIVIHLGDFAFKRNFKEIREKLNGTIILIRGNHDFYLDEDDGFIIVDGNLRIGKFIFSHRPLEDLPEGFINIHGHIHDKDSFWGINVSVEKLNYTPLRIR